MNIATSIVRGILSVFPSEEKRCPQCWQKKPIGEFIGAKGGIINWCVSCREHYHGGPKTPRKGVPVTSELRASLFLKSGNRKLGGIPSSITSRGTCPPSCGLYNNGCYAEVHVLAHHWRNVGKSGGSWQHFCAQVAALPVGQLWRHSTAGDLPGDGDEIDEIALDALVRANKGRRGFTFTHKPVHSCTASADDTPGDLDRRQLAIHAANRAGFVVNLSADGLAHADRLAELGIAPVAAVVPSDAPKSLHTPAGRRVTLCPAEDGELTCATCELCAVPDRKVIVGFRAHGQSRNAVDRLVQLRRKDAVVS